MLGPRFRSKGCVRVGPSPKWIAYWVSVLWAAAAGYAVIRPWLSASLPPIFRHVSGFEFLLSALASLSGIVIAGIVAVSAAVLYGRLRLLSKSSPSTDTTGQSQETQS